MDRVTWMWLLFVLIGLVSMARPRSIKLFQRRRMLARMSDYYETPERKRIALRIEQSDRWFSIINGACMVLAGLSLRFISENVFMAFFALSGLLIVITMVHTARMFSSK